MSRPDRTVGVIGIICLLFFIGIISYFMFFADSNMSIRFIFNPKDKEQKYFEKIKLASDFTDNDRTIGLIEEFLMDYPDSSYKNKVLAIAAEILYQKKDYEMSKKYIEKVVSSVNSRSDEYVNAVITLGKIGLDLDYFDPVTVKYLEDAYLVADAAKKENLAVYLGFSYLFKKDYNHALLYFNQASGEFSFAGKARVYIEQGKYQEAFQEYLNYFSAFPKGNIYEGMKKAFIKQTIYYSDKLVQIKLPKKSIEYLSNLIGLFPKDNNINEVYLKISQIYQIMNENKNALLYLNKALQDSITNNDDLVLYNKAVLTYQMNQKKEALKLFHGFQDSYSQSSLNNHVSEWILLIQKDLEY